MDTEEDYEEPANVKSRLKVGSLFRTWAEVSRINYLSSHPLDVVTSGDTIRRRTIGMPVKECSLSNFVPAEIHNTSEEQLFYEQFPVNVISLLNENQYWGCFYNFPELYENAYSPVVKIRNVKDVADLADGVLTMDIVAACLSYLKRIPILGDFVYIKLDLSAKHLINIDVLENYKYLVHLDLSSNMLTELSVLSHLHYLQYLSVAFNRLNSVLEFDTPQWFLTEVHYKFNSVKKIRDISAFWSITILDLSHNNIKLITGLECLWYLRRLDLSFNHIQRLENLNHLRLIWLDVSYNNISTFEISFNTGLWTLYHLEYLNINENNLTSMKIFSGCTRLRELHARNNGLSMLLELAVYMRQMRRLITIDLRANPVCETPGYKEVVINTFPNLLSLDAEELDPEVQRTYKMEMKPDIFTFASHRLLRLLYIEQMSRARVSPYSPSADTTDVPLVVLVGYEAVGKGILVRRLVKECTTNIELARQHTTSTCHLPDQYLEVTHTKFDDMLLEGEFLTYNEMDGESYGLSRKEAAINEGKMKIVCMELIPAVMLRLRGLRPYLILVTQLNKRALEQKQRERRIIRNMVNVQSMSMETPFERSTLQVLISGRIIITGILNEIILSLPEGKEKSEFLIESECSLMMDSDVRQAVKDYVKSYNMITLLASGSTASLENAFKRVADADHSLHSLYKESQGTNEFTSFTNGHISYQECNTTGIKQSRIKPLSSIRPKSVDFSRYASSTWKVPGSAKSSKSVTFNSQDIVEINPTGNIVDQQPVEKEDGDEGESRECRSISAKFPPKTRCMRESVTSCDDTDLWLAFLQEACLLTGSTTNQGISATSSIRHEIRLDDPESIIKQLAYYKMEPTETATPINIREGYEEIHRTTPGLFWDTVVTDNIDEAYLKLKRIVKDIYNSQHTLKPMFDIDFANMQHYPIVENRLENICKQIAPHRLFN